MCIFHCCCLVSCFQEKERKYRQLSGPDKATLVLVSVSEDQEGWEVTPHLHKQGKEW